MLKIIMRQMSNEIICWMNDFQGVVSRKPGRDILKIYFLFLLSSISG